MISSGVGEKRPECTQILQVRKTKGIVSNIIE